MRTPAALLAAPLAAGCLAGVLAAESASEAFALRAAAASLLALLSALALHADRRAADVAVAAIVSACFAGISLGSSACVRAYHPTLYTWFLRTPVDARGAVALQGVVREDAAETPGGVGLTIDVTAVDGERVDGGVRLTVAGTLAHDRFPAWRAGRHVAITAALRVPAVYWNPGVPDDRRALARRGIVLVGSVKSGALVDVVAPGSVVQEWAGRTRAWARSSLAAAVGRWSDRSASVAAAIAIGDRSGLPAEDERRLQAAGTYHVIAISGGNIAILTLLLLGVMRAIGVPPSWAAGAAIAALVVFRQITGPAPSVDRAIAAAVIFLAGRLLELRGPSLNVLAVAAVLGLGMSPTAIVDAGFILSFGATLAILACMPHVEGNREAARAERCIMRVVVAVGRAARGVLAATVAAELALAPVSAFMFARVTCAGLLLNFAAIPLMTLVQIASLVTLAVGLVDGGAAARCGYVVHVAARALVDSARLVELAPWATRELVPPHVALLALYYAALVTALLVPRLRWPSGLAAAVAGMTIVLGLQVTSRDGEPRAPARMLRIAFLDVGQADATLIVLPDGRAMLVDSAGLAPAATLDPAQATGFDVGERVVARALRAFGVRALDTLVITHGDPDHLGGAPAIVRAFAPRAVWEGIPVPPHAPMRALRDVASAIGAEWRSVRDGERLSVAGVDIGVLHPAPADWERQRVRNDDSVVLDVRYGRVSVILPGDIGSEGELAVMARLQPAALTVLKAPHHGSATSSSARFLEAASPRVAIFSAGRANRFGHPAPAVVARYRAMGAALFSTADDGAVIVDTDGRSVMVVGWRSGRTLFVRAE